MTSFFFNRLPIKTVVSRFVSLRWTLTNVGDVSTIVEGQPGILLRHAGEIAGEMAALANEFPAVDVGAVVVREPCLAHRGVRADAAA